MTDIDPNNIDPSDHEYFRDKTYEYAAMRAKLRELAKAWRARNGKYIDDDGEAWGRCANALEALLEVGVMTEYVAWR